MVECMWWTIRMGFACALLRQGLEVATGRKFESLESLRLGVRNVIDTYAPAENRSGDDREEGPTE